MTNHSNSITMAVDVWPDYLDPALTNDFSDVSLLRLLHEAPLGVDPSNSTATVERINGQRFRITPAPAKWSNGEPVIINQYLFNLERLQIIDSLRNRGRRSGFAPFNLRNPEINGNALEVTFNGGDEFMLKAVMADPIMAAFPTPPSNQDPTQLFHQIGGPTTGPFSLSHFDQQAIKLRANPYFEGEITMIDIIRIMLCRKSSHARTAFEHGKIDLSCLSQFGCVPEDCEDITDAERDQVGSGMLPLVGALVFNTDSPQWRQTRSILSHCLKNTKLPCCCLPNRLLIPDQICNYTSSNTYDHSLLNQQCVSAVDTRAKNKPKYSMSTLSVSYCDYYPNRLIVESIGEVAKEEGLTIKPSVIPYDKKRAHQQQFRPSSDIVFTIIGPRIPKAGWFFQDYIKTFGNDSRCKTISDQFLNLCYKYGSNYAALSLTPMLLEIIPILPVCIFKSRFWIRKRWRKPITKLICSRNFSYIQLDSLPNYGI